MINTPTTTESINLVGAIEKYRKSRIKVYPCHTNRASELGHDCLRYLVYARTAWDQVEPYEPGLQGIFDDGNLHERDIIKQLLDADIDIFEQQAALGNESLFKNLNVTAHIDWKVREGDLAVPIEFKTMNSFIFDSIHTIDDIKNSKKPWVRKYYAQFTLYLLMTNSEYGYFLLKNKNNAQFKQIRLDLDYEFAEGLLAKAKVINKHVDEGTLPERMKYDRDICDGCKFKHLCNPPVPENSMYIIEDPKFEKMLNRHHECEKAGKEFKRLDKEIKEILKESNQVRIECGEFILEGNTTANGSQRWKIKKLTNEEVEA